MSVDDLSPQEKRALLAQLLQTKASSPTASFSLSPGQQALWLIHQLDPESPAYHVLVTARLRSTLDVPALQRAFQAIIDRHAVLRTTYVAVDGEPRQQVHEHMPLALDLLDAGGDSWETLDARISAEACRPFDLEHGPIIRVTLFRRARRDHLLLCTVHHIAIDTWSLGILLHELRELYPAMKHGAPMPLAPLAVHYRDHHQWLTQMLAGPEGERQWAYWQQQLAGALPVLNLPTDRPRPPLQTYCGASHPFQLSAALTQALKALAQAEGATLYMLLLAAFQLLLQRYTGQDDILVGSPIAGRSRPQFRQIVGYCANPVVFRGDLSGNPSFATLLQRVRRTVLDALRHADYPFPLLVQRLQPTRDASRSPLFQVCLALQTLPQQPAWLALFMPSAQPPPQPPFGDLVLEPHVLPQQEGQFDLTLGIGEVGSELCGFLQYNTDLFDAATATRMVGHFETLLAGIVAHPHQALATLPILTEAERQLLLETWNATQAAYPQDRCIHELFEAQTERTPDAIAVVCEDTTLTYRALNQYANQLAHYLQELGVAPNVVVGLCVERSVEMIVGLLGILKAGGTYVPLDPTYPQERLTFMLADARVSMLLTQQRLLASLPAHAAQVVCLDADWQRIARKPSVNPHGGATGAHLAYMIYTSGSTGKPKGAMIPHSGLVNYLTWCTQAYAVAAGQGAPVHSSLAFDLTITGLFAPLLVGRQVVLVPDALGLDGLRMALQEQRDYSLVKITPAHLEVLGHQIAPEKAAGLTRAMVIGGEALLPEHIAFWQRTAPDTALINEYGPTETVVGCCIYQVPAEARGAGAVPIGRPIANTQLYVLDAQLQPVPIGVIGQLYIGGAGVAWGYHNRPALTAEVFVPHPFSQSPGARLYKTGDLARYLPDGNLEFLGRTDHQVNIRGFRIELGEIEAVLNLHPAVQDSVILAREDPSGDQRLVAYLVPAQEPAPTPRELRGALELQLPSYMIPSAFIILPSFPLTPNGKVDRQALPLPEQAQAQSDDPAAPPRTPREAWLATIWRRVLDLDRLGIHDNFFDSGGHSLQAIQLVSHVAAELQIDISINAIFVHPTIASLADALAAYPARTGTPSTARAVPEAQPLQPASPFTVFERRPLLPLFATGEVAPVAAAALAYLPTSLLEQTGLSREELLHDWCANAPRVFSTLETTLGRIALIVLPYLDVDLYRDPNDLIAMTLEALALAGRIGAHTVSLTGLLPSATAYGRTIAAAIAERRELPRVSTGHATTTAAVVLTIHKLLQEGGRHLSQEHVGFLGLGSIGLASLRLMLRCLPHPTTLTLCDVYSKHAFLARVRQELADDLGFRGTVRIVDSHTQVPSAFYEATLIIGATNIPNILDITRVRPGTMIVDDSAPHCFDTKRAIQRFEAHHDLLFTEGGAVRLPHPIVELRYLPSAAEQTMTVAQLDTLFIRHEPAEIMGCTLSSLLSCRFEELPPTVGFVDGETTWQHYHVLRQLGFQAANLQCEGYVPTENAWQTFRQRFERQTFTDRGSYSHS